MLLYLHGRLSVQSTVLGIALIEVIDHLKLHFDFKFTNLLWLDELDERVQPPHIEQLEKEVTESSHL